MEAISKRKLDVNRDYENLLSYKKHRYEDEEGYEEPLSPMLTPAASPTRADVIRVLPRVALDFSEFEELTPFYSVAAFSFITWRNSEPLVLFKKVKTLDGKGEDYYIIAHKLKEKWVKIAIPPTNESLDKVQYLGNGNYILVNSNSYSNAFIFKTFNVSRIINSLFQYEANSKLVRTLNLGCGVKSTQSNNGLFAVTTFNESFGQCRIFSRQGVVLFDFNLSSANSDIPSLNEPYAINLDSKYLYLYYWDSFPLVRISLDSKKIEIIQNELPIVFANHVAISDREAILGGGCPRSTSMLSLPDYENGIWRVDLTT